MLTVALADLGAGRDAVTTATGVDGRTVHQAPPLLVAAVRITDGVASVRLHRRDQELGRWVPSAVAAQTLDPAVDGGCYELRWNTASIEGDYALVQESGAGVVTFYFRPGRN